MSRRLSYWACRLSIQYLFRPASERVHCVQAEISADGSAYLPRGCDAPTPEKCYLWTLTFPDALTRGDARLAMKRWDSFRKYLDKTGKFGVRVIERGEKGAFHFHIATPQRWSAREIWDAGERYGFGRVDVRERPISAAYYLAKYIGKAGGREWLPRGMRQWACFGFAGVSQRNLRYSERERVVVANAHDQKLFTVLVWRCGESELCRVRPRPSDNQPDEIKTMEIKPAASKDIISKPVGGMIVALGEFRGATVRSQTMKDSKTQQSVERVLVECSVEFNGKSVTVTEWTKPGTQLATVRGPAVQRGEPCLVEVESMRWYGGSMQISGFVRPLPTLV